MLKNKIKFSEAACLQILMYLCPQITKTKIDMEVISIERSTYEELLTSFNSFVAQMRAMADRGTDKKLGNWLDNQDVCLLSDEQARQALGFCLPELLFHNREFSESVSLEIIMYLCPQITKTK